MFKVFIYLYIFLESFFVRHGSDCSLRVERSGCSPSCSMGGSWEVSQACSHQVGGGLPVQRVRRQLSIALHIQYSQVNVTHATRDNHHWVRNSTLPPAYSSCPPPCWPAALVGRAPAPLFFR